MIVSERVALAAAALAVDASQRRQQRRSVPSALLKAFIAGEVAVPVNKSQVIRSDRPYAKALIGNPDIADVLPLTDRSLYVLGKKIGTTSLTLYDRSNMLIAVVDVAVGPDVISLRRQLSRSDARRGVGARISNDSVVLEGMVPNAVAADRAVQIAESYAGQGYQPAVDGLVAAGHARSPLLRNEAHRLKQLGLSSVLRNRRRQRLDGVIGGGASVRPLTDNERRRSSAVADRRQACWAAYGIVSRAFTRLQLNCDIQLDALERKGAVTTLAEPTLVAFSGETANFLAGGEFPVPVAQTGSGGSGGTSTRPLRSS